VAARVLSQNGWPAYSTPQEGNFVRFTAGSPSRGFWAANPDVAVVAQRLLDRFDAEVEKLVLPGEIYDDWSHADRNVRGSTNAVSNHGSATAWDTNATKHPLGAEGTFSRAEATRINDIIASITDNAGNPVLRWGGNYRSRKDEMHFEVIGTPAQVKQAADKIRNEKEEDDVSFQDKHKLTAADVNAYGDKSLIAGKTEKSFNELTRFPPATARLRRETKSQFTEMRELIAQQSAQLTTLTAAVQAMAANNSPAVREAFAQGIKDLEEKMQSIRVTVDTSPDDDND
jgi:hypothetical protein